MDGPTTAAVACAVAGGTWVLLGVALLGRRLRFALRGRGAVTLPPVSDAHVAPWAAEEEWADGLLRAQWLAALGPDDAEARTALQRGLRDDDPNVRRAAVTGLGRLADHHEWAIDGLIEALAEHRDAPATIAAQLDRVAPRAGTRLAPLLGHPSSVVRFYAVRLLARCGPVGRRRAVGLVRDPSPNVRAAALETLEVVATGDALRGALRLLDDPHPLVRAQACRTAAAISALTAAPFVRPLLADPSWWVRDAARESLVAAGREVAGVVVPALEDADPNVRSGAALVLQDVGVVDSLVADRSDPHLLERIFAAGGTRVRSSAVERARRGLRLGGGPSLVPEIGT
jgi:HEAT repeat protein